MKEQKVNALYRMEYTGRLGKGSCIFYMRNGGIAGADVADVIYHGNYEVEGQRLRGAFILTPSQGDVNLVTGDMLRSGEEIHIPFDFPMTFTDGQEHILPVGDKKVIVTFQKIRDMPLGGTV